MTSEWSNDHPLLQSALIDEFRHLSTTTDPWIVLYRDECKEDGSRRVDYCVVAPLDTVDRALRDPQWSCDLRNSPQLLGDVETPDELIYSRTGYYSDEQGASEQLILLQDHSPIRPSMLPQLSEDFRIYHDLWLDPSGTNAYKIYGNGDDELAAEISAERVRVRTSFVRQYLAGTRRALIVFTDSLQVTPPLPPDVFVPLAEDFPPSGESPTTYRLDRTCYDYDLNSMRSSRVIGKAVLYPGPVEQSGIYPYHNVADTYPQFIIGIDHQGKEIRFSCDPKLFKPVLGGINESAPSYLTPVYFSRTVLARYYNNPKFFVMDGAIGCGNLWAIRADLDRDDFVVVYIGDLGEYLPSRERRYWVPHNVVPQGGISETTHRRHFLSEPAPAQATDHRFSSLYWEVNARWRDTYGWPLFRPTHPEDRQILRIHIPLDDNSPAEFDEMILALTKLLIDYLNKREIAPQWSRQSRTKEASIPYNDGCGRTNTRTPIATLRISRRFRAGAQKELPTEKALDSTSYEPLPTGLGRIRSRIYLSKQT